MHCLSFCYKTTPLYIREKLSFSKEEKVQFETDVMSENIQGCIVISTCNRSEIYFSGVKKAVSYVENMLINKKAVSKEELKKCIHIFSGEGAIKHLCQVTCGMDSMVLGEDEILRQVKEAYVLSLKNGVSNYELNVIFHAALQAAKAVKTDTRISAVPVSIGSLTANKIVNFLHDKKTKHVLLVGAAGKIGSIVAKNLLAKNDLQITGTSRSHKLEYELFGNPSRINMIPYNKRYQFLTWSDVVVSATASPHYTFTLNEVRHTLQNDHKNRLFIDLAVPCDIDKEISDLNGICMMDIDDFKALSKENNRIKSAEIEKAEIYIENCVEDIKKAICYHEIQKDIGSLEKIIDKKGFPYILYQLKKNMTGDEINALFSGLRNIVKEEI